MRATPWGSRARARPGPGMRVATRRGQKSLHCVLWSREAHLLDANGQCGRCSGGGRRTCGVHLHGVGDETGVTVRQAGNRTLSAVSLDSSLVSIGKADPVPTPLKRPEVDGGFHFALVGNIWNTNYPFWYPFNKRDHATQFRFRFTFA